MDLLCDSNVFVAIAVGAHSHHQTASRWFEKRREEDICYFCRATQNIFLRLVTTKQLMNEHVCTNEQAIELYRKLRTDARVGFMNQEPAGVEMLWLKYARITEVAPRRWMDAYLAAWAKAANMRFVTFDRGFKVFEGLDLELLGGEGD